MCGVYTCVYMLSQISNLSLEAWRAQSGLYINPKRDQ